MNILVSVADARRLEAHLETMRSRAVPHAVRDALNQLAFTARSEWVSVIKGRFILRNRYTEKSLRVTKARGTNLASMESVVGSVADYMDEQEDGGKRTKRGKHGVAIPTASASGQSPKAKRTRPIRQSLYLGRIQVPQVRGSRSAKNGAAIAIAKRKGQVAYLDGGKGKGKGLFKIMGSAKRPKPRMIYDLGHGSVEIPASRTLDASVKEAKALAPAIAVAALRRQIDRMR